ncbi:MAG: hypothetical protein Q8O76_05370, partial [Chloroflexota bacterium]|nr:hypothetical protein [Chloroflexota bacterium]
KQTATQQRKPLPTRMWDGDKGAFVDIKLDNPDSNPLSCPGCNQGVGSLGAGTYQCDGCGAQFQVS